MNKIIKVIKKSVEIFFILYFILILGILIKIIFGKIGFGLFLVFIIIGTIGIIKEKINNYYKKYVEEINIKEENNENSIYINGKKENGYKEEYLNKFRKDNNENNKENKEYEKIKKSTKIKVKEVLNKSELNFYRQLKSYLDGKGFFIFCKVRLVDFLDLSKIKNYGERTSIFNKVSRKHIDFLVTDLESKIKFVIELDGRYHYYDKKTIENDKFKNELFKEIGVKLIRFNVKNGYYDLNRLEV